MKQTQPTPKSGDITIGKKPIWQLWVESEQAQRAEYDRLVKLGYVSARTVCKATGWSQDKTLAKLVRGAIDRKPAYDPETGRHIRMFLMPAVSK